MLFINLSVKSPHVAPNSPIFLLSAYFGGHFVTIATVQVVLLPDFYTLAIVLINYKQTLVINIFFYFLASWGGGGGQNSPLMHVALCTFFQFRLK